MILPVESAKPSYVCQDVGTDRKAINKGVAWGQVGRELAVAVSGRGPGCHREGLKTDFLFPGAGGAQLWTLGG